MDRQHRPHDRSTSDLAGEPTLTISSHSDEKAAVIALAGELDLDGTARFQQTVLDALATETIETIELDLRKLRFIDSSGLQAILRAKQSAHQAGIDARVVGMSPAVERVIDMAGLGDVLGPSSPDDSS
jgi:anti-sigma B factor antagonist